MRVKASVCILNSGNTIEFGGVQYNAATCPQHARTDDIQFCLNFKAETSSEMSLGSNNSTFMNKANISFLPPKYGSSFSLWRKKERHKRSLTEKSKFQKNRL